MIVRVVVAEVVGGLSAGAGEALALGDEAEVADAARVGLLGGAEFSERGLVRGRGGEVVHFVAVALEIVEFLGGFRCLPEDALASVEGALVVEFFPDGGCGGFELGVDVLALREVREVVA